MQINGDIYSNLVGYMDQLYRIGKRAGHTLFSKGTTYYWYNPVVSSITATKDHKRPDPFLGNDDWVLLAVTVDGKLRADEKILKGYGWPNEED